jgi:hypothetical protein
VEGVFYLVQHLGKENVEDCEYLDVTEVSLCGGDNRLKSLDFFLYERNEPMV